MGGKVRTLRHSNSLSRSIFSTAGSLGVPKRGRSYAAGCRTKQMSANASPQKSAKARKRALPHKNRKQPGLKQPGLGTPKK